MSQYPNVIIQLSFSTVNVYQPINQAMLVLSNVTRAHPGKTDSVVCKQNIYNSFRLMALVKTNQCMIHRETAHGRIKWSRISHVT